MRARAWVAPEPVLRVRSSSVDKLAEIDLSPDAPGGSSVAGSRRTAAPSSSCSLTALPGAPLRGWAQATRGSSGSRSSSSSSEGRVGSQASAMMSRGGSGAQSHQAPDWGLSITPNGGRPLPPTPPHQSTSPRPPRPAPRPRPATPLEPGTPASRLRRMTGGGASEGGAGQGSAGHLCRRGGVACHCCGSSREPGPAWFLRRCIPSNLNSPPLLLYTLYIFISLTFL